MKLLINEPPVMYLPSLAYKLGQNEAILLQQLHYWLLSSAHRFEGRRWVYNTAGAWMKQLGWRSEKTVRRTILSLEKSGYIERTDRFNQRKYDKTNWFTINYEKIAELEEEIQSEATRQNDQSVAKATGQNVHMHVDKMTRPIPETTRDKNSQPEKPAAVSLQRKEISDHAWFTGWWCFLYESITARKYPYKKKHAGQISQLLKSLDGDLVELVSRTCSYFLVPPEKLFPEGRTIGGLQYMIDQLPDLSEEDFNRFVECGYLPDPEGDLSLKQFQPWKDAAHVKAVAS